MMTRIEIADALDATPRQGSAEDRPEGARILLLDEEIAQQLIGAFGIEDGRTESAPVRLSDTLAREMATALREVCEAAEAKELYLDAVIEGRVDGVYREGAD